LKETKKGGRVVSILGVGACKEGSSHFDVDVEYISIFPHTLPIRFSEKSSMTASLGGQEEDPRVAVASICLAAGLRSSLDVESWESEEEMLDSSSNSSRERFLEREGLMLM
jgi:hypothetical protein